MYFGDYLKRLRIEKKIKLREVANKSGIDVGFLSRVERNIKMPSKPETIEKLYSALSATEEEKQKLNDLLYLSRGEYPADIKDDLKEYDAIPVLLRTFWGKKVDNNYIKKLIKKINSDLDEQEEKY